jgi:hypothetical protein
MKLSKTCPAELHEAVCTLCYVAGRHQHLTELIVVRRLLAEAYGKEFVQAAVTNQDGSMNATVAKKIAISTPCECVCDSRLGAYAITHTSAAAQAASMMQAIATKYEVEWTAEVEPDPTTGVFPEVASTAKVLVCCVAITRLL